MKTQWLAGILAGVLLLGGCARVPEETRETAQPPAVIYTYPVETIPTTPPARIARCGVRVRRLRVASPAGR